MKIHNILWNYMNILGNLYIIKNPYSILLEYAKSYDILGNYIKFCKTLQRPMNV